MADLAARSIKALPRAGRGVEGIVEMMLDAIGKFSEPLTKERLFAWHASLFLSGANVPLRSARTAK